MPATAKRFSPSNRTANPRYPKNRSDNEVGGRVLAFTIGLKGLIVRTDREFDFLGYHFSPEGLAIAQKTLNNFVERAIRLYEQKPGEPCSSTRLGEYAKRWVGWVGAVAGAPLD